MSLIEVTQVEEEASMGVFKVAEFESFMIIVIVLFDTLKRRSH